MSFGGEIIQIHIGQAGVQIANACWELYCLEHGIMGNGCLAHLPTDNSFLTFFGYSGINYKVVPRLLMVDTEPTVIDEVRSGSYKYLFHPDSLITGTEDSGSNYARGYNLISNELCQRALNAIRRVAEGCHNLRGFLIFRAVGGGTGSGFATKLMENLRDTYGKNVTIAEFTIFPSPSLSPVIVEPYNAILSTHFTMDIADVSFIIDNEALYDICVKNLHVQAPTYTNLNRIVGQVVSAFTASQRFSGPTNVNFQDFQTNLVPFPRMQYPLMTYAPLVPLSRFAFVNSTVEQLTDFCFTPGNQMIRCDPSQGKYMACVLLYRGDVSGADVNRSLELVRSNRKLHFVDWAPTGFKVGVNAMPPSYVPGGDIAPSARAVCAIANNTIIHKVFCRITKKFDQLYNRRAFVYHYIGEGMEEGVFEEAAENICQLLHDYMDVQSLETENYEQRKRYPTKPQNPQD